MFAYIRIAATFIIAAIGITIICIKIKEPLLKTKRIKTIAAFLTCLALLSTASVFLPIENLFVEFPDSVAAYKYVHGGDVNTVVEGKHSDLVIGKKNGRATFAAVAHDGDGRKVTLWYDLREILSRDDDGVRIKIYAYKGTSDYYLSIMDTTTDSLSSVSDSIGSMFYCTTTDYKEKNYYTFLTHLDSLPNDYVINVGGRDIDISSLLK